jgi:hypothetical protein
MQNRLGESAHYAPHGMDGDYFVGFGRFGWRRTAERAIAP